MKYLIGINLKENMFEKIQANDYEVNDNYFMILTEEGDRIFFNHSQILKVQIFEKHRLTPKDKER